MNPQLGPYRILGRLGAGGMGVVYRAFDERLQREVALKLLPLDAAHDLQARARLLREARAAGALNHPHICTIFEVGESDGQVFIAMELIEGETLGARVARHPGGLTAEAVLRLGAQVADALAHAHERGIVHRDLKSANVLLTSDGRIKVLDFGLARRSARGADAPTMSALTLPGTIAGTPSSLAPEALRGETADERGDVWALGILLYEMACGRLPFSGQTEFELAASILHEPPAPLPDSVAAGLRALVLRCLAKDASQRPQSAAEVRAALEAMAQGAPASAVAAAPTPPVARPGRAARSFPRRAIALAASAVALVVAVVFAISLLPARRIRAIAVLPIANLSRDPEQDYFADGMTEELITHLAQVGSLRVISRASVMLYRQRPAPIASVARELGVDAVIEGTVLRADERVRITARLVRGGDGQNLWAGQYDRELRDVLSLQNEVCRAIVEQVRATLTPSQRARLATADAVNPEAHEAWLRGRFQWNQGGRDGFNNAVLEFKRAIEIDPGYAHAYSGLAEAYSQMSNVFVSPDEVMPKARAAADRALALDSTLADAHSARAYVSALYDWRWDDAERGLRRALNLNPNSLTARLTLGYIRMLQGRFAESDEAYGQARAVDPLSGTADLYHCILLYESRRFAEGETKAKSYVRESPAVAQGRMILAQCLLQQNRAVEALPIFDRIVLEDSLPYFVAYRALAHARAGDPALLAPTRAALLRRARTEWVNPYSFAVLAIGSGDREEAFAVLERCVSEHVEEVAFLKNDPIMDPLRGDARYLALLRRIGLAG